MSETPDITLVTATGDRHRMFALVERCMADQDFDGLVQWIVIDDGTTPTCPTLGQDYVRRERSGADPEHTLGVNLLAALSRVEADKVLFIEDDEYYGPAYLSKMAELLDEHAIVGEGMARYYSLKSRRFYRNKNTAHASLSQTGIRAEIIDQVVGLIEADPSDWFIDLKLWKLDEAKHVFTDPGDELGLFCGFKNVPGRVSPVNGNRKMIDRGTIDTDDHVTLRKWCGDAADRYIQIMQGAGDAKTVAIISQGPTGDPALGLVGDLSRFDAVIAVNTRIHQYPGAQFWAFSDQSVFTHKDKRWHLPVLERETLPQICTKSDTANTLRRNKNVAEDFEKFGGTLEHELLGLPHIPHLGRPWNKHGGPGALGLAWYLKPDRVECFGCDMGGESDVQDMAGNRGEDRWAFERRIWGYMAAQMAGQGIDVVHAQPDGSFKHAVELHVSDDPEYGREFQYANAHGWVTTRFTAASERDFRERILAKNMGVEFSKTCNVREVVR